MDNSQNRPKALLWDFDGTLGDTEVIWAQSQMKLVDKYQLDWTLADAYSCSGKPIVECVINMIESARAKKPTAKQIMESMMGHVIESLRTQPYPYKPGVVKLLDEIIECGIPCGLVSSSYRSVLQAGLAHLPEGLFKAVVAGDDPYPLKPDPAPYLTAAEQLGVDIADCVIFEDSVSGVRAGVASGAAVIVCPDLIDISPGAGYTVVESLADITLADVFQIWRQLRADKAKLKPGR